jgi:peptidoglycan hydrolase-like protein with peptidoglycan-binding domain
MFRSLALASALVAASLSASALSAQTSAAPSKPSAPTTSPAPTVHAKMDSGSTSAMNKSAASKASHAVWTTDQIKEAQEGLAKAGFYKGKPTGQFNADTRKALKSYQKKNKLPVTGRLNDEILSKLKSA